MQRRSTKRIGKPFVELSIGKQVHAKQGHEIGKGPVLFAQAVKPAKQQQRDECGPDLDEQSVFRSTDKRFDFQILFEGFEKDFNLPTLAIDVGDGGSTEVEMIR